MIYHGGHSASAREPREEALAPEHELGEGVSGLSTSASGKQPVLTDEEISRKGRLADLENKETEVAKLKAELETETENRKLRRWVANGALVVMLLQIVAANATFVWYGDTNDWDISPGAISAWMGATVIQVVSVVLVIINYLFPKPRSDGKG